jgi:hypothetical protein
VTQLVELLGHLGDGAREPLDYGLVLLIAYTIATVVAILAFIAAYPEDEP